jgi:hypothetical protein
MTGNLRWSRRQFLDTAAAACGAVALGGASLGSPAFAMSSEDPMTRHFWYRLQADGPYIDSQRDHRAFGFTLDAVMLSEDCGRTWPHRLAFPAAQEITFSHIFENGNVLFATAAELFLGTENLTQCRPVKVLRPDGSEYRPHVPQTPKYPGWYFHPLNGVNSWMVDGREMLVWGNYCNVEGGGVPVNIYYSVDNGETVKLAYSFGQNPDFGDNGTPGGGPGGTLLGDEANPVICRHIHCVSFNPAENAFYACTGDGNKPKGLECHWLRGTYDPAKDAWDWKVIVSDRWNSRYKCGGINFVDNQVYWIADANGEEPYDRGIFRCAPADIPNRAAHEQLFDPQYECANMIIEDGVILAAHYATASPFTLGIIYSPDLGKTWTQYDLREFGERSPVRFHRQNSEGWFRVDLRKGWISRGEVLFIKPRLV